MICIVCKKKKLVIDAILGLGKLQALCVIF